MASTHQKQPPPNVANSVPFVFGEDCGVFIFRLEPAADPAISRARLIRWLTVFFINRRKEVEYHQPYLTSKPAIASSPGIRPLGSLVIFSAFRSARRFSCRRGLGVL